MKWTKKDVRIMCQAISTFWLINRPLGDSSAARTDALAETRAYLASHRVKVVLSGIAEMGGLAHHRWQESLETARHFEAHPNVYGDKTPEMVERFNNLAGEHEKDYLKAKSLMDRIEAEGLPPEVESYDPVQKS